jgi:hypothetical protein
LSRSIGSDKPVALYLFITVILKRIIRNYFGILVLVEFKYRHSIVSNAVIGVFLEGKEKNKKIALEAMNFIKGP